jgi:hypothetical protein
LQKREVAGALHVSWASQSGGDISLVEQGATDHQLMAWFGWTSISQVQVYTKAANSKRMAVSAGKLISGTGIGSLIDPVSQIAEKK